MGIYLRINSWSREVPLNRLRLHLFVTQFIKIITVRAVLFQKFTDRVVCHFLNTNLISADLVNFLSFYADSCEIRKIPRELTFTLNHDQA